MGELTSRREKTAKRISDLRDLLGPAEKIASGKASVYATGSFGRGEAGDYSDLDLFIVGRNNGRPDSDKIEGSSLSGLDTILVKAELIECTRKLKIQDFSGDGQYLTDYSVHKLVKTLGEPHDDVENTFTARLLLLLESRPLIEAAVYNEVIADVVTAYWRDYEQFKSQFIPAFLANDILRLWRTFCINYEARTEREPKEKKAKGKIKNYKLKHSRLLTCYSALFYLLVLCKRQHTVSPRDALEMVALSPTERLEWLLQQKECVSAKEKIEELLRLYEDFLAATNTSEADLIEVFLDPAKSKAYSTESYKFGDAMYEALRRVGEGEKFFRLLLV